MSKARKQKKAAKKVAEFSEEWNNHECINPEVIIEPGDFGPDDVLRAGMHVLIPCPVCGETPLDALQAEQARSAEMQNALFAYDPDRPLFHWAPASRRGQITRYGLRPGMRATTTTGALGAPCVCLADSPSWAWALSGEMRWTSSGEWDLWQTTLGCLTDPLILPSDTRKSGIYEVRVEHRIYKRDLWWVGSRTKR